MASARSVHSASVERRAPEQRAAFPRPRPGSHPPEQVTGGARTGLRTRMRRNSWRCRCRARVASGAGARYAGSCPGRAFEKDGDEQPGQPVPVLGRDLAGAFSPDKAQELPRRQGREGQQGVQQIVGYHGRADSQRFLVGQQTGSKLDGEPGGQVFGEGGVQGRRMSEPGTLAHRLGALDEEETAHRDIGLGQGCLEIISARRAYFQRRGKAACSSASVIPLQVPVA